jgi:mono/diheme cytochrome c family protein
VPSSESTLYRVLPGRPSLSYLFQKLAGVQAGIGVGNERMPLGGPYLGPADMDAVRAWILEGARDN